MSCSPTYEMERHNKHNKHRSRSPEHHRDPHTHSKHRHKEHGHIKKEKRDDHHYHHHHRERSRSPVTGIREERHHRPPPVKCEPEDRQKPIKQERHDAGVHRAQHGSQREDNRERKRRDRQRIEHREGQNQDWGKPSEPKAPSQEKEQPNFELSGKLTADTNTYKGVVIKYNEPEEARKPRRRWRLYPFKGDDSLPMLHIHRQSAFLFGRDRRIADIPVDHPSCSKQHAVFQYRMVPYERPDGKMGRKVQPYIIDLGSANGTYVNNKQIEAQRYVELFEKDVLKFGYSSREYVLLHDDVDVSEVVEDSD